MRPRFLVGPKANAIAFLLLALSFFVTFVKGNPQGEFHILGPGGGGAMFHPTISPHDEKTVSVSCDMTGSYLTKNGGQSWRTFNLQVAIEQRTAAIPNLHRGHVALGQKVTT